MHVARSTRAALRRLPRPVRGPVALVALRSYEMVQAARVRGSDDEHIAPAHLRVLVDAGSTPEEFEASAERDVRRIVAALARTGDPYEQTGALLDFGCGVGRILARLPEGPALQGTDTNRRLVRWCQGSVRHATALRHGSKPPLPLPPAAYDVAIALSVFTHLPDEHARAWAAELRRVLRPGGRLLVTAHGERYLDRLSRREREAFGAGHSVVHFPELAGTNACAAFHPGAVIEHDLLSGYELLDIEPGSEPTPQDLYVARATASP